jgi:hypothetical protein
MKVFICLTVAQEIDGRNLFVRVDKASKSKDVVESFMSKEKASWVEKITTPEGELSFACERHPHELEVEDA